MWERSMLKNNAKKALSTTYWASVVVCLLYGLLGGVSGVANVRLTANFSSSFSDLRNSPELMLAFGIFMIVALIISLISILMSIFVGGPIEVGKNRYFMQARVGGSKVDMLFAGFRGGAYMHNVGVIFKRNLFISLWSLLFVIPGVIKTYEYFMVPYILAENPNIDSHRAFQLSKAMTDGEKFNIWVLQLSFLGWELLSLLTCGIGMVFLRPYIEATNAELYALMREKAFALNISDPSELPGFTPPPPPPFYGYPPQGGVTPPQA